MFNFEGRDVRVVMIDGNPWFVALDACRCIGLQKGGKSLAVLDQSEWTTLLKSKSDPISFALFDGCMGRVTIISESGLYKLIMRSDKPAAKRFQNWIAREVLPALRKDGMYVMGEEKVKAGEMSLRNEKAHRERASLKLGHGLGDLRLHVLGQGLLGLLLILHEVLADGEASLGLLQHGEVLGGVEGQEVLLGRAATEGVFNRSVKNHEVLVLLESAGFNALLDPVAELALRAERLVQLTGVDGVDQPVLEGGAGADGDEYPYSR